MQDKGTGLPATIVALWSAYVSWSSAETLLRIIGSIFAIVASVMAIRYYHRATNKIK